METRLVIDHGQGQPDRRQYCFDLWLFLKRLGSRVNKLYLYLITKALLQAIPKSSVSSCIDFTDPHPAVGLGPQP